MVWRRRLRKLSSFKADPVRFLLHVYAGRVLRGTAQSALFEAQSLLLKLFSCLHDMGDAAGDKLEDNLNPIGRAFYGASTLICTPASLSQELGLALGAQAGEKRLREAVTSGGFSRFCRATLTPVNLILEPRPSN